ncbi:hypothetical protein, partial [Rossellomorea sp. GCM10028870]|uniref:hypothetical protein n=1 Tax=Rossellomorea sp. GCM10028870 TaxID=3273426 RepID=UPI003672A886
MPNTEVKLFSADGSWGISPCESRTSPGKYEKRVALRSYSFFVFLSEMLLEGESGIYLSYRWY